MTHPPTEAAPRPLRCLCIAYRPLTDPLLHTQCISYLSGLVERGHSVHLVTFEKPGALPRYFRDNRKILQHKGIVWHGVRCPKKPAVLGTAWALLSGVGLVARLIRKHKIDLIHARAQRAALIALWLKRRTGCPYIIDFRGLEAEEWVDSGRWKPNSRAFATFKRIERACLRQSSGFSAVSRLMRDILVEGDAVSEAKPWRIIPCCANFERIEAARSRRDEIRQKLGLGERPVMLYVGGLVSWHMPGAMAEFFVAARQVFPDLHFLALVKGDASSLHDELKRLGVEPGDFTLTQSAPEDVGAYLNAADMAISFNEDWPSRQAASPAKVGEYLAGGLPIIANTGIAALSDLIRDNRAGVLVEAFETEAYERAARQVQELLRDPDLRQRCREAARAQMSLQEAGIPRFAELYEAAVEGEAAHQEAINTPHPRPFSP